MTTTRENLNGKCICVWYDDASGGEDAWVVTRDNFEDGIAATSHTLSAHGEDYDSAVEAAKEAGTSYGLPVYEHTSTRVGSRPKLIQDAE